MLLVEFGVDHGVFGPDVLKDIEGAVKSGRFLRPAAPEPPPPQPAPPLEMGWKPTEEMLDNRRDYHQKRIFTIDPTSAKDLGDDLHIELLPDGRFEIGVHIADVLHFITPGSAVDSEELRRATMVYLVDRVVPMLPKPLCE